MGTIKLCTPIAIAIAIACLALPVVGQPTESSPPTGLQQHTSPSNQPTPAGTTLLGLPRPAVPYPMEPGLRFKHAPTALHILTAHVHRTTAGKYWLFCKYRTSTTPVGRGMSLSVSSDGTKFNRIDHVMYVQPIDGRGYVPGGMDMLNIAGGQVLAFYTNGQYRKQLQIDLAVSAGADGRKWTALKSPLLEGTGKSGDGGPADPSLVSTASGYRMYYVRSLKGLSHVFSAASPDGRTWTPRPLSCLTTSPRMGIKSLSCPSVIALRPGAWFMTVAVADQAGKRSVGMAVSADGLTFQYLGSLSQILDLSAFTSVRSPTLTRTASGQVRLWLVVAKADGTTGVATASLPPAAVTCVPANPISP